MDGLTSVGTSSLAALAPGGGCFFNVMGNSTQTPHAKPAQTHTRTRIIIILLVLVVIHKALLGIRIIPRLQQAINFTERLVAMALEGPLAVLRGVRGGGVDVGGTGA